MMVKMPLYALGRSRVLGCHVFLLAIICCRAEVNLPPFVTPESQITFYFTEQSFNLALTQLTKNMSSVGIILRGASDSFDDYPLQNFSISPMVLGLFDVAVPDQEATDDNFASIKNISGTGKAVGISFSSMTEASVYLVFNKFTTYGFGGYFGHDFSDLFLLVDGASQPTSVPSQKAGTQVFIGMLSSINRIKSVRFQTNDKNNSGGLTLDSVYLIFSETGTGPPISVYYDFDSWAAATQDFPTFMSLEKENFESFDPFSFNSSTIHFNLFTVEIPNITFTTGSTNMGIGDYGASSDIGNLAQDGSLVSHQELALTLDSIENPSISVIFDGTMIGFGGLFFYAFSEAGIQFRVNGQHITFTVDHQNPTFLGIVVPSGTKQVDFTVPPGESSSQTFIVDDIWIAPHSCVAAKCLVEGLEFASGVEIGHTPLECVGENSYRAEVDLCGHGGVVERNEKKQILCPDYAPKCQQCGPPRRGGAICIAANAVMPNCSFPANYNDTGCLLGDNNYAVPVGYQITPTKFTQCSDNSTYFSTSVVCGLNMYPEISISKSMCPKENPFCFDSGCCPASGCVHSIASETSSAAATIQLLPVTNINSSDLSSVVQFEVANLKKEKRCLNGTEMRLSGDVCKEEFSLDLSKSPNLTISFEVPKIYSLVPNAMGKVQFKFNADSMVANSTTDNKEKKDCNMGQALTVSDGNLDVRVFGENCDMFSLSAWSYVSISDCQIKAVIEYGGFFNISSRDRQDRFLSSNSSARISKVEITASYDHTLVIPGNQSFQDSSENGVTGVQLVSSAPSDITLAPPSVIKTDINVTSSVTSIVLNPAGSDFEPASSFSLANLTFFEVTLPTSEKIKCAPLTAVDLTVACGAVVSFVLDKSSWIKFTFAASENQEMVLEGTTDNSLIFEFRATAMVAPDGNQTPNCKMNEQKFNGSEISTMVFGSSTADALFSAAESSVTISACEVNIIAKFVVASGTKVIFQHVSVSALYDRSLVSSGVQSFHYTTADKTGVRTASFSLIPYLQKLPICCTRYDMSSIVQKLRSIPRFGFSGGIENLFAGSSNEQHDYVIGLIVFPSLMLGFLLLWLVLLLVFKCLGRNRVGFLSGANTNIIETPNQEEYLNNRMCRCKCTPRLISRTFVSSAVPIFFGVMTFYMLGVKNLQLTTSTLQRTILDLKSLAVNIEKTFRELNKTAVGLEMVLPQMLTFCYNDPPTALVAAKFSMELGNEEVLGAAWRQIESLRSSLFDIYGQLDSMSNALKKVDEKFLYSLIYAVLLSIFTCLFTGSAILARRRSYPYWLCLHNYITFPVFVLFIFTSWCCACAILAGSMLNADACSGGAVQSPYGTANKTLALLGSDYYQLLAYYASCSVSHPAGVWLAQYDNYVASAISLGRPFINEMQSPNFTQVCSASDKEIAESFIAAFSDLESVAGTISSAASQLSCKQISPIYNKAVNESLCAHNVTALMWMMWSLLLISVCGMIMITLRAAAVPLAYNAFEEESYFLSLAPKKNPKHEAPTQFEGQIIRVASTEVFENLSVDSDIRSENNGRTVRSYADTNTSFTRGTGRTDPSQRNQYYRSRDTGQTGPSQRNTSYQRLR